MTVFVSSDHHFGHRGILKYRDAYDDLDEMNEDMIRRWNDTVDDDDIVHYLGDLVMGPREQTLDLVKRLNGFIILCPGNHDHVHPMYVSIKSPEWSAKWQGLYLAAGVVPGVESWSGEICGLEVGMCHFPFDGDHTEENRYSDWRPTRLEESVDVLLHGHVHNLWAEKDHVTPSGRVVRQINVGADVRDFTPVRLDEILS